MTTINNITTNNTKPHLLPEDLVSGQVVRREQPSQLPNGRLEHAHFRRVPEGQGGLDPVPRPVKLILHAHQPQRVFFIIIMAQQCITPHAITSHDIR